MTNLWFLDFYNVKRSGGHRCFCWKNENPQTQLTKMLRADVMCLLKVMGWTDYCKHLSQMFKIRNCKSPMVFSFMFKVMQKFLKCFQSDWCYREICFNNSLELFCWLWTHNNNTISVSFFLLLFWLSAHRDKVKEKKLTPFRLLVKSKGPRV